MERAATQRRPFPWFRIVATLASSLLLLLVIAPLLGLLLAAPLQDLRSAVGDPEVVGSLWTTLSAALTATLVCTAAGIPLAYQLARSRFWGRSLLMAIIDLPIVIPHPAAGIALLLVLGRQSWLGGQLEAWGVGVVGRFTGIVLAMSFVSLPFLVNAARDGFAAVPVRTEQVARTLGAGPGRVFFTISLPLAWRSILSGMVMMWGRGISEFGAVIIIAYHPMTSPVLLFQRLNDYGLASARSVAVLLVVVCVSIFGVLRLVARPPARERDVRDA
jgi:molybdate/tungstate transport system permease protein